MYKVTCKLFLFQLWDIRDGMCKQTFSGHESDINAIVVSKLVLLKGIEICVKG